MKTSIVAIPLFAAIWLSAPTGVLAQDTPPEAREVKAPRTAVPRQAERRGRDAETRAGRPDTRVRATEPRAPATSPQARADGPRDRNNAPRAAPAAADQQRARRSNPNGRGPSVRDQRGRDNRGPAPRVAVRRPPNVGVYGSSYRPQRYYAPAYYDRWARQTYRWSPLGYAPWALIYGSVGLSSYGYSYGHYDPYGYSAYGYSAYGYGTYGAYGRSTNYDTGSLRLQIRPRDAAVFVDGYYAGLVDDFDGNFQSLRIEAGGHKIEIRLPGFETLELDIHVQPGRTITLREDLIPRP